MINLVETASFSFPKSKGRENQDSIMPPKKLDDGYLFAVADGVGSYHGGKNASQAVISILENLSSARQLNDLDGLFKKMREKVSELSDLNEDMSDAATTLTLGYINEKGLLVGHIGDCRLYVQNKNTLSQITRDHTQHQFLIDEGLFTKKFLSDKKAKNILTTAISPKAILNFDEFFVPFSELPTENQELSLYVMSDGAYEFWERRPRFASNTMKSVLKMLNSFKQRFDRYDPIDDYSSVGLKVTLLEAKGTKGM